MKYCPIEIGFISIMKSIFYRKIYMLKLFVYLLIYTFIVSTKLLNESALIKSVLYILYDFKFNMF